MKQHKTVAKALVIAANATCADGIAYFADDKGMLEMYQGDCDDTIVCADAISAGDIDTLHDKLWRMDTAAREAVGYAVHAICPAYFKKNFVPYGWCDLG